ncbi:MAG: type IV pilus biogenesis/stability protein PilW [Burkholderiales bacterium]
MKKTALVGAMLMAAMTLTACVSTSSGSAPLTKPDPAAQAKDIARVHTELASEYYSRAQFGVALEELNEARKADPNYVPAYSLTGLVYMELREDALAVKNFEQALRLNPADSDANNNYGWYLCNRGQEANSIKYFLTAQKNPLYTTPERSFLNAGICSRKMGDDVAAENYLRKALAQQPDLQQALFQLSDLNYKRNNLAEARAYMGRLMRNSNPNAEYLWLGVRIERKLGNRDNERGYAEQLRRRFPNAIETQALLAGRFE